MANFHDFISNNDKNLIALSINFFSTKTCICMFYKH